MSCWRAGEWRSRQSREATIIPDDINDDAGRLRKPVHSTHNLQDCSLGTRDDDMFHILQYMLSNSHN